MNIKSIIYIFIAFVLPWLMVAIGLAINVHNPWLYAGGITWFSTALILFLSFYKS